jgi:hypothetical protein
MAAPRVSVVMPARNAAAFLGEAVASVRAQTLTDWELLLVDDGSTDETPEIPTRFHDERIRVLVNTGRSGIAGALNTGLEAATGHYIARLDADDSMLPNRLRMQTEFLDHHPNVVLCGSWLELFGATRGTWQYPEDGGVLKALLLFQCCIGHPSVMLRREDLNHGLRYAEELPAGEDYDLWVRLCHHGELHCLPTVLTRYRRHGDQETHTKQLEFRNMLRVVRERWLTTLFGPIDPKSLALHEQLASLAYPRDPAFVDTAGRWFDTLLADNELTHFFEKEALQTVLAEKLYDVCSTIAPEGLAVYRSMRRQPLSRHITSQRRGRVFLKALMGTIRRLFSSTLTIQ